jgi:hypothetical protein
VSVVVGANALLWSMKEGWTRCLALWINFGGGGVVEWAMLCVHNEATPFMIGVIDMVLPYSREECLVSWGTALGRTPAELRCPRAL